MSTIITFSPLAAPRRNNVSGAGRVFTHECNDGTGEPHRQRLPLGSVRGIYYLDALCLYCGSHFVWVEDEEPPAEK